MQKSTPLRVDAALRDWFLETHQLSISREKIKTWLSEVRLTLNGNRLQPHDLLNPGASSLLLTPPEALDDLLSREMSAKDASKRGWSGPPLPILKETTDWIAIDKPFGLPSVPLRSDDPKSTAADFVRSLGRSTRELIIDLEAGAVHRLDNDTSGVLLFAKTTESLLKLNSLWESQSVHKIYRALCVPEAEAITLREGLVLDLPIARDGKTSGRSRVISLPGDLRYARGDAMPARTEVVKFRPSGNVFVEIEVRITTGVPHQIRAHLAHAGFPIAGDQIYAPDRARTLSRRLELYSTALGLPEGAGLHWIRV